MVSVSRSLANRIKEWVENNYSGIICVCEKQLEIGNIQSPKADLAIKKKNGDVIAIEIEDGQPHPDTNVTKYWYMKVNFSKRKHLTIIQIFSPRYKKDYQSRVELCRFVAKRMKQDYPTTFKYIPEHFSGDKWGLEAEKFIKNELREIL